MHIRNTKGKRSIVMAIATAGFGLASFNTLSNETQLDLSRDKISIEQLNDATQRQLEAQEAAHYQRMLEQAEANDVKAEMVYPDGIAEAVNDAALTTSDSDFAWRATWQEAPNWGGRIGFVDDAGVLRVKLRYTTPDSGLGDWMIVAKDVKDFQLMDWRIAVRKKDDTLWFGNGALNEPLVKIDENVDAYQMTLTDIGTIDLDGEFKVSSGGQAIRVAKNVHAMHLTHEGRMAILGDDSSLWLFEGGYPTGSAFRQIGKNVASFQLEREYIAMKGNDTAATLHVAKVGRHQAANFTALASKINDFAMEIEVKFDQDFAGEIHLAAVDQSGKLLLNQFVKPNQSQTKSIEVVGANTQVNWASRQLVLHDASQNIRVSELDQTGKLGTWQSLGSGKRIVITGERAALIERNAGDVQRIDARVFNGSIEGMDVNQEKSLRDGNQEKVAHRIEDFGLSSLRPMHTRKAMIATRQQETKAPLAFVND